MAFFLLIVALLFLWLRPTQVASQRLAA